jgi:hypothetical protein
MTHIPPNGVWTCRVCCGPCDAKRPIVYDVVKNVTAGGDRPITYYVCNTCAEANRQSRFSAAGLIAMLIDTNDKRLGRTERETFCRSPLV